VGGRHPDVHHGEVGAVLANLREQRLGVIDLPDHLEAGALEQAGNALPQEDVVVGYDHSDGVHGCADSTAAIASLSGVVLAP
jgi:hypothetical protein